MKSTVNSKKEKTENKSNLLLGMAAGTVIIVTVSAVIYLIEMLCGVTLLSTNESRISSYLELMGVSFSVTFITTSLLGGLSDKSEKIYWLSYPEAYLINSRLNFMLLSSVSFLCLLIQALFTAFLFLPEMVREAVFTSSFVVGITSIVILSYRFTAVFFSRKKLVNRAQADFKKLIDEEKDAEIQKAVVGLFNNTLEAVDTESSNFERVSENIRLLFNYQNNDTCSFWLRKLIVEIGRKNSAMLSQLLLDLTNTEYYETFIQMIEKASNVQSAAFDSGEVLNTIYELRLKEFKKKIFDTLIDEDGRVSEEHYDQWEKITREWFSILTKIDTERVDNCILVLENLYELPYIFHKDRNCMDKVIEVWGAILKLFNNCVIENDTVLFPQLQKPLFDFMYAHTPLYFDKDLIFRGLNIDSLADALHRMTAETIADMKKEQFSFMVDMIEDSNDKNEFILWFLEQMAEKRMSKENIPELFLYFFSAPSSDSIGAKKYYESAMNGIILGLINVREAVKDEYERLEGEGSKDKYSENDAIILYKEYVDKYLRLMLSIIAVEKSSAKNTWETKTERALKNFIKVAVNDTYIGEDSSYPSPYYDPFTGELDDLPIIINRYAYIFDTLLDYEGGLLYLSDAIELGDGNGGDTSNLFFSESEAAQKKEEMLFFLNHVNKALKEGKMTSENKGYLADLIVRVVTNPCMGLWDTDNTDISGEVKESISILKKNDELKKRAKNYIAFMYSENYIDDDCASIPLLASLYANAENNIYIENTEYGEELNNVADLFSGSLQMLDRLLGEDA